MSNNRNKENSANRSGVNSGPSSQQRPSKRVAFGTSFFESESLARLSLNDNTNDFGLRDSDDNHDDLFDLIGSMAADPMPFVNNNNNNNNNNLADRNVAAVASAADALSAASNDDNLAENNVAVVAAAAPIPNNSNANIAAAGSNNSVAALAAVVPSAPVPNNSNVNIAVVGSNNSVAALAAVVPSAPVPNNSNVNIAAAGSNNSVAVNIDTEIAQYKREARNVGARLLLWDSNDKTSCPVTVSLNSTSSRKTLKLIGAVTSISNLRPDGTKENFYSMLATSYGKMPSHFGSVEFPIQRYHQTHSGVAAPDTIYYQRQKPGERQVFSINGTVIVVPPKWVLEYRDNKILPLSTKKNWKKESIQVSVTLFMQKGRSRKQLATLPGIKWCANVMGVRNGATKGATIRIQYMDGNEMKSADVTIEDYKKIHGEIGKVTKLGSKVLPRAYLVVPENPLQTKCDTLDKKRGLSAKFRVNNVFGGMFPFEICKTITEYLFYEAGNPKKSYEK